MTPRPRRGSDQTRIANGLRTFTIALGRGFRGHTVVITVDGRDVYHRAGVTTDPRTARADAVDVTAAAGPATIAVAVTPGHLAASLDVDMAVHRLVTISLVGGGTVSFETFGGP